MKRFAVTLICVFVFLAPVSAQRAGFYLSGGLDGALLPGPTDDTGKFLLGPVLHIDGRLFRFFSIGVKVVASIIDFDTMFAENPSGYGVVTEALLALRAYPLAPAAAPENGKLALEPFVELSGGYRMTMVLYQSETWTNGFIELGSSIGLRFLLGPSFFIEPYFRAGLPLAEDTKLFFAGGILLGGRLGKAPSAAPPVTRSPAPSQTTPLITPPATTPATTAPSATTPLFPSPATEQQSAGQETQDPFFPIYQPPQTSFLIPETAAQPEITPIQEAPVQTTPMPPVQTTPIQTTPMPPVQTTPIQTTPVQNEPVQTTPVQTAPPFAAVSAPAEQLFVVYFAPNTAVFDGSGLGAEVRKQNLDTLAVISKLLKDNPAARALIEGEANPVTGTARERATLSQLSLSRANSIAQYLKSDAGIGDSRFVIRSEGGARTLVPRSDKTNWEQNRRVEIRILW